MSQEMHQQKDENEFQYGTRYRNFGAKGSLGNYERITARHTFPFA